MNSAQRKPQAAAHTAMPSATVFDLECSHSCGRHHITNTPAPRMLDIHMLMRHTGKCV